MSNVQCRTQEHSTPAGVESLYTLSFYKHVMPLASISMLFCAAPLKIPLLCFNPINYSVSNIQCDKPYYPNRHSSSSRGNNYEYIQPRSGCCRIPTPNPELHSGLFKLNPFRISYLNPITVSEKIKIGMKRRPDFSGLMNNNSKGIRTSM